MVIDPGMPIAITSLNDYDELFIEKLQMLLKINENKITDWPKGKFTPKVDHLGIYPRTKKTLPILVATGGSIESMMRTAEMGLPIVYAIIGGNPHDFKPLIQLYRAIGEKKGYNLRKMTVAAHSWGWLEDDKDQAIQNYFYLTKLLVDQISSERPHWQEMTYEQYLASTGDNGAIFVGDADTVAKKIIRVIADLGLTRFYLHLPIASMPHDDVLKAIGIYGKEVVPKVKQYFRSKELNQKPIFKWKK